LTNLAKSQDLVISWSALEDVTEINRLEFKELAERGPVAPALLRLIGGGRAQRLMSES
jgi:hypothetical protein